MTDVRAPETDPFDAAAERDDQRDPHRGELPPHPFQPVGEPERTAARRRRARAGLVVRFGRGVERICLWRTHICHRLTTAIPPPSR